MLFSLYPELEGKSIKKLSLKNKSIKKFNNKPSHSKFLLHGGLPAVYLSEYPEEELDAYVNTYLKEEIMAEGLIRKLLPFSRLQMTVRLLPLLLLNMFHCSKTPWSVSCSRHGDQGVSELLKKNTTLPIGVPCMAMRLIS